MRREHREPWSKGGNASQTEGMAGTKALSQRDGGYLKSHNNNFPFFSE